MEDVILCKTVEELDQVSTDLCRLLGLSEDASFEEIQEARNYLYQVRYSHVVSCIPWCHSVLSGCLCVLGIA